MAVDERRHERAQRHDLEALRGGRPRAPSRRAAAEPAALERLVDLGVDERDPAVRGGGRRPRRSSGRRRAARSARPRARSRPSAPRLRLRPGLARKYSTSRPGASDDARVVVVEEAAPVGVGVLPRLALLQVAEDRPRAVQETAVLGLEHGGQVAARPLEQARRAARATARPAARRSRSRARSAPRARPRRTGTTPPGRA